jgi:hypothetical protein
MPRPVLRAYRGAARLLRAPLDPRRRRSPLGAHFERGLPIDRYYIEAFLERHRADVRGIVLEVGDREYTERFGNGNVRRSDVLHAKVGNPVSTIVGDLATGANIPTGEYDCIIVTQVYPFVYDVHAAIRHSFAALREGGVLLATLPSISQISRYDMEQWGDYWRFTSASSRRLFGDVFGRDNVEVEAFGNVLAACAFLYQLGADELSREELDDRHPDYEVTVTVRAVKRTAS